MVRKAENGADQLDRERSKRVGALAELWPFLRPYRLLLGAAIAALVLTAAVALVLPMAVRRVVDNFGTEDGALLISISAARSLSRRCWRLAPGRGICW